MPSLEHQAVVPVGNSVSNWRWRRWAILLKSFAWLLDSLWSWPRGSTDVLKCLDIAPKSSFNMSIKLFYLNILFFNQDYHKDQSKGIKNIECYIVFFLSLGTVDHKWVTTELCSLKEYITPKSNWHILPLACSAIYSFWLFWCDVSQFGRYQLSKCRPFLNARAICLFI